VGSIKPPVPVSGHKTSFSQLTCYIFTWKFRTFSMGRGLYGRDSSHSWCPHTFATPPLHFSVHSALTWFGPSNSSAIALKWVLPR